MRSEWEKLKSEDVSDFNQKQFNNGLLRVLNLTCLFDLWVNLYGTSTWRSVESSGINVQLSYESAWRCNELIEKSQDEYDRMRQLIVSGMVSGTDEEDGVIVVEVEISQTHMAWHGWSIWGAWKGTAGEEGYGSTLLYCTRPTQPWNSL